MLAFLNDFLTPGSGIVYVLFFSSSQDKASS